MEDPAPPASAWSSATAERWRTLAAPVPSCSTRPGPPDVTPSEVLRLAASLDQYSPHVLAQAIVDTARQRDLELSVPTDVTEEPERGATGTVNGHQASVGRLGPDDARPTWSKAVDNRALLDGAAVAWLTLDGHLAGAILLRDPLRHDAPRTLRHLRTAGIQRILMLTGDRAAPAHEVAAVLGLDGVRAELSPADKVSAVRDDVRAVTVMVGDGVNDAPAADVGVATGARGATASSEAADIALTTDRVDRLADAVTIAQRARRIAVRSALGGMVMSLAAMAAAAGLLPPAVGATPGRHRRRRDPQRPARPARRPGRAPGPHPRRRSPHPPLRGRTRRPEGRPRLR